MKAKMKNVEIKERSIMDWAIQFVVTHQLKNKEQWSKYPEAFELREDSSEGWWRGEFFGKQMRGATLVYAYTKDEELYEILTETVKSLLEKQDEFGRISTYAPDNEFFGWDMWCRKYVLVGLLYYYDICKDEELKKQIINACCRHLDYIVEKIGDKEGQKPITATSSWWGCVNSCTILEPTVELYKKTKKESYLDFAKYIISTGGCSDCNLVELALKDEIFPYQYPVVKAYEMMSFYEGLVAYYEVTGEQKYFDATCKFFDAVAKSDITIIGCSGCTHELFDNSSVKQTEYQENIMQETCVTVTWIRVLRRLFNLTKNPKYIDWIEQSGYNALYGSLNTELNKQWHMFEKRYFAPMPFDSYSPLYMNTRGRGIGGCMEFKTGGYSGCCIAIGACGIALMPQTAVTQGDDGIYFNFLTNSTVKAFDLDGREVEFTISGDYPAKGKIKIEIKSNNTTRLQLNIRKPNWCEAMSVNGNEVVEDGYYVLSGEFKSGDIVEVDLKFGLKVHRLNGKVAFTYGAITLAIDEQKASRDLKKTVVVSDKPEYEIVEKEDGEIIRIICKLENGEELLLTDYQSCGKKWLSDKPLMTVWFNS